MTLRHYRWLPDRRDLRDFAYTLRVKSPLPLAIDLRPRCSPVTNQGQIGSCSAHALIGNMEFLENKDSKDFHILSKLFVYYNERFIEGDPEQDRGARLRDGIKALKSWGVCSEKVWPYEDDLVYEKPTVEAYKEALKGRISLYERMKTLGELKDCLASGFPFVFGFVVYPSFESITVTRTGRAELPQDDEKPLGGHAVLAVGYDDVEKRFLVKNSWGSDWGDGGYFTLPYAYFQRGLAGDFWSIQK